MRQDQQQQQLQQQRMSIAQQAQLEVLEETRLEAKERLYRIVRRFSGGGTGLRGADFDRIAGRVASIEEELRRQIRLESVRQEIGYMVEQIVEYLDADGLLRTPDTVLARALGAPVALVTEARDVLKRCEPTGIGARDEWECRLLCAEEQEDQLLISVLKEVLAGRKVKEAIDERAANAKERALLKRRIDLLPKRPAIVEEDANLYPEADIKWDGKALTVEWYDEIETDAAWTSLPEAKHFLSAYERRGETLRAIVDVLLVRQADWFKGELSLEALTKREVAQAIGRHESTVGRALAGKAIRTVNGTIRFDELFVSRTKSGQSSFRIKARMAELIRTRPEISDQQLVHLLAAEGLHVARRTVAKYRDNLGLTRNKMGRGRDRDDG
ncbi:RNA polymerase factor sigma-54 [Exiguobacterium flavidum]|uniref:RNA polymerase factor sigma-54 n=1 Tax=Exiguobacterium flavidum TaxID=2184695 RepID=UPI000DF75604|nr:RNA polymerase subunit sigma-54 [Exiguobacterium flavidum]